MTRPAEERLYDEIWQAKGAREADDIAADGALRRNAALPLLGTGKRLLDVGCGEGSLAVAARHLFHELHGVDITASAVERARSAGVVTHQVNLNVLPLPYPDEYFDTVVTLDVIEHIFDPVGFLVEIRRVLMPGGLLVVSTPNIRKLQRMLTLIRGRFPRTSYDPVGYDGGHLHYFTSLDLKTLLEDLGFEVTHKGGICGDRRTWKYRLVTGLLGRAFEEEFLSSAIIMQARRRNVQHR